MKETDQPSPLTNYGSAVPLENATEQKRTSTSSISDRQSTKQDEKKSQMTRQKLVNTLIICFCQLLNFMDRYALPGMLQIRLPSLKKNNCYITESKNYFFNLFLRNIARHHRRMGFEQLPSRLTPISLYCQLRGGSSSSRLPRRPFLEKVCQYIE